MYLGFIRFRAYIRFIRFRLHVGFVGFIRFPKYLLSVQDSGELGSSLVAG